jgi:HEAT repeats
VLFSLSQRRTPENATWMLGVAKNPRVSAELRKSALFWAGEAGASARDLGEIYDNSGDDTELRGQVIFTLSQRRNDRAAVDKLLDIARKERDPELRKQALFWLGQSRDPRAAAILEEIINKPM